MGYDIEDKQRRLLNVRGSDVGVQTLIGGGSEVCWRKIQACPICGGKVLKSAAGELLSPNRLVTDENGVYGTPHRHRRYR